MVVSKVNKKKTKVVDRGRDKIYHLQYRIFQDKAWWNLWSGHHPEKWSEWKHFRGYNDFDDVVSTYDRCQRNKADLKSKTEFRIIKNYGAISQNKERVPLRNNKGN